MRIEVPVASPIARGESLRNPDLVASLDAITERVRSVLYEDYHAHTTDQRGWQGSFEYVIMEDPNRRQDLLVVTRLFPTAKSGAVFYGRRVRRLDADLYALWIDD